nr:hypothetical protein ORM20_00136 [Ochrobactrum phage ORM_20]
MAEALLLYINRSAGTGTGGAPSATYESALLVEGTLSNPTDGRFKTALVIPKDEDVYIAVGANPDVDEAKQQILVPLGATYEVAIGVGQRFALKASGTNAGTGAGGGGGGGTADAVKIDPAQNTVKLDATTNTVKVSGNVAVTGPLTDTQLRATAVPVSGSVGVTGNVAVTGPLTDTQLRATAVPVSGTVTATGPLTNAQYSAITGVIGDSAWSGTGNGTLISILKALYAQNAQIITLLGDIKTNTTPTP